MKNIYDIVVDLLKSNERYLSEDENLLKANIYSDAMTMNKELIEILLKNEATREKFFVEINNNYVFDKQGFAWFVEEKEFLPDSYTKYSNKIGLTTNGKFINQNNDVVIDFPFKDCVLEGGQTKEDQKRDEIFFNETIASDEISRMLSPKVFSNTKRYSVDKIEENVELFDNDNLIIKGNNLIAIASLLKRFEKRIKCIYIDVPYNTGSDSFGYNDNFNHSTWLVFMKNRLELLKKLLKDDGVIIVQVDYNEQAYLKVLMDEIFRNGYISMVTVKTSSESGVKVNANKPIKTSEYLLIYAMDKSKFTYIHPKIKLETYDNNYSYYVENVDDDYSKWCISNMKDKCADYLNKKKNDLSNEEILKFQIDNCDNIFSVRDISDSLKKYIKENNIDKNKIYQYITSTGKETLLYKNGEIVFVKNKIAEINGEKCLTKMASDIWTDIAWDGIAGEGNVVLKNGKKPERLLYRLISSMTDKEDIVLDAFFGTGTTGAVALKMNRRFIGIEQLDAHINLAVKRLKETIQGESTGVSRDVNWNGGGSFVYCELKENGQELVNYVLDANENSIDEIKEKIINDDRIISYITKNEIKKADKEFNNLSLEEKKKALITLIDKNKLYINYSDIDDMNYKVTEDEKSFTKSFYEGV